MSKVIIVGSGATYGILKERAPLSVGFGKSIPRDWCERYPYLFDLVSQLSSRFNDITTESWALNKVWGYIDTWAKLQQALGWPFALKHHQPSKEPSKSKQFYSPGMSHWDRAGREMRCLLTAVYGDDLKLPDKVHLEKTNLPDALRNVSSRLRKNGMLTPDGTENG